MLKTGVVAAAMVAGALMVPVSTSPAEAVPVSKPAVKEMTLKHKVHRWRRGFRGFRGRGFRGLRFRRGFRGRRFYGGFYPRLRFRRFYRPRHYYYGGPYVSHRYYGRGRCWRLKRNALATGKSKWWRRYHRCRRGYY